MADATTIPLSPDVIALIHARAQETQREPQAVVDEILRNALEPNYFRDDAHREAFNEELKRRIAQVDRGFVITMEDSLADLEREEVPDTILPHKGGIYEALRRSPLVGADLAVDRDVDVERKADL